MGLADSLKKRRKKLFKKQIEDLQNYLEMKMKEVSYLKFNLKMLEKVIELINKWN